jgi:hypothetical protein
MQNAISFMWCVVVVVLGSFLLTSALEQDDICNQKAHAAWMAEHPYQNR